MLFPAEEDFGIVPVEAQACGAAVIAFGKGGATETIRDGVTGLFFAEQTTDAVIDAVDRFERMTMDPTACRANAEPFAVERYERELFGYVDGVITKG